MACGGAGGGGEGSMKAQRARRSSKKTYYLVLWWMAQTPYAAVFEDEMAAEAAANVRNALMIAVSGRDVAFERVADWYRRDDAGAPMPAEWRDLVGQIHAAWSSETTSAG